MKVYTYWENAPGRPMPPYVALSIANMQRQLGGRFELLTARSIAELGPLVLQKHWAFEALPFTQNPALLAIVAKSDYVRLAWIALYGGIWLDADMIVMASLDDLLARVASSGKLHWSSEAFFAAAPGHAILREASKAALASPRQAWGNPGGVRDLIAARPNDICVLDPSLLDPGYVPQYGFPTCDIMHSTRQSVEEFLTNPDLRVLKLYNTYFSRSALNSSPEAFLSSGTLLARLFLAIKSDPRYWLEAAQAVMSQVQGA